MAYRFNNFQNLKSQFYPSDKQVKIFHQSGKIERRNANGPWSGYSTKKALKDRAELLNTLAKTTSKHTRTISPSPWVRSKDPKVKRYVSNEIPPKWTKISNPPETKYDEWQSSRLKKRGANYQHRFFENRLSALATQKRHLCNPKAKTQIVLV